jgi:hypothetical protein
MSDKQCNGVELMLDLETLGTNAQAPVISIGAVLFDPRATNSFDYLRERSFYSSINIEDAVNICGNVDGGTVQWWFQQTDAAIKRLVNGEQEHLGEAIQKLFQYSHARTTRQPEWHRNMPVPTNVWAKDPDFDCVILRSAAVKTKVLFPFHFANTRSVRTIQELAWPDGDVPRLHEGVAHDARDDAIAQAMTVQAAYRELGLGYDRVTFH